MFTFTKAEFYTFVYGTRVDNAKAPPFLKFRSSRKFIVSSVVLAVFTDIFLYSVIVPILPFALTVRAGVHEEDVQKWTAIFLSVYGAALAVGSPIFGYFADRTSSRRAPLLLGLIALGGSTGMLCAGNSLGILLAGRFMQGLSASVVWPVGLALISDTVPKESIGNAMGYVAAATSAGNLLGPLLGGLLYNLGYYAVFGLCFAVICLDIFLRLILIEKRVAAQWSPEEQTSTTTETIEAVPSSSETPSDTEIKTVVVTPESEHTAQSEKSERAEIESVAPKLKWTERLPPLITLLAIPRILVALFGCLVVSSSQTAFDSVLPLFVKNTFSWTSTGAGLIFIALIIPSLISPVFGIFSDKFGSRTITTVGLLGAVPLWVLLRFVSYNSISQKVLLCALLVLLGFCFALVMAPLMADIDHAVTLEEKRKPGSLGKRGGSAQAFGLFNLAWAVGSLVGPLLAGFIAENAGWGTMGWSLAILSGVCGITTFLWTGGRIKLSGRERRADGEEEAVPV